MELMRSLGVPEFSLLGTSYGRFAAFRLAHMFPAAVKRVIISNSGILMTPEDNVNLVSRGNVLIAVDLLLPASPNALLAASTLVFHRPLRLPHFLLQDFWSALYTSNRKEKEELVQSVVLGTEPASPVPLLQQEVLLIWGEHDRIFPIEHAHKLQRHLGKRAQLAVVKNAAHVPQLEQPTEFNGLVKAFLLH